MGFRQRWIAMRDIDADEAVKQLALRRTGEFEESPESPITGAKLASGWYIVVFDQKQSACPDYDLARTGVDVVTCELCETTMTCQSEAWADGSRTWAMSHDPDHGITDLRVDGTPPPHFAALRDELAAKQAAEPKDEVDYFFDLPTRTAGQFVGYQHDRDPLPGERFEVLEFVDPTRMVAVRRKRMAAMVMIAVIGGIIFFIIVSLGVQLARATKLLVHDLQNGTVSGRSTGTLVLAVVILAGTLIGVVRSRVQAARRKRDSTRNR